MKEKENRYIPNPRGFAQEIAEETKLLRQEITEGITRIYYPLDFRRNVLSRNYFALTMLVAIPYLL
ncbi:hypothetical protein [Methanosarcina mazei]|nr:hypothetical protein [Methanosarcina mazei]QIB90884.1 hypothetical protein FQU78_07285 [Methanosarcina mazei]